MYAFNRCTWLLYNHFCCRAFCPLVHYVQCDSWQIRGSTPSGHAQVRPPLGVGKHRKAQPPLLTAHELEPGEKDKNRPMVSIFSDLTLSCSLYGSTGQRQSTCKLSKFSILTDALYEENIGLSRFLFFFFFFSSTRFTLFEVFNICLFFSTHQPKI